VPTGVGDRAARGGRSPVQAFSELLWNPI
jgi:hypothetical protein